MRRNLAIILLLLLIAPTLAFYGFLEYRRAQLRAESRERIMTGLDRSQLVELVFARASIKKILHWEDDQEFEYQGHLYDIVEERTAGDSIRYLCFNDQEETGLRQQIGQLVKRAMKEDRQNRHNFGKLLLFLISLFWQEEARKPGPLAFREVIHFRYAFHLSIHQSAPPNPPPEA